MRVIFNEDPNHFAISRLAAGYTTVTRAQAEAFIDQYQGTGITDFMICLGASANWYHSRDTESALTRYHRWQSEGRIPQGDSIPELVTRCAGLLTDFYDREGEDIQQVWLRRLRHVGIRPWISIRMNDIHDGAQKGAFLHSDFYDAHIDTCGRASHRTPTDYFDYGLDYLRPEVRAHYKRIVREGLQTFDADGIEFDWQREARSVQIGRESEGLDVLTDFMTELFDLVREAEAKWGHPIDIAVRVPDSPEKCMRLGLDVLRWLDTGRVQLLSVTPRWGASDHDMPLDLWRRILGARPIRLAAGQEILLTSVRLPERRYLPNTPETARGFAYAHVCQGAEVYLFNYMDALSPERIPFCGDPAVYRAFLQCAGDRDALAVLPRRHVVTHSDMEAPGAPARRTLPLRCRPGSWRVVRIPVGTLLPGQRARLVLGLTNDDGAEAVTPTVYINGVLCERPEPTEGLPPAPDGLRYVACEIPAHCRTHTTLAAELGVSSGECTVAWAEIIVG